MRDGGCSPSSEASALSVKLAAKRRIRWWLRCIELGVSRTSFDGAAALVLILATPFDDLHNFILLLVECDDLFQLSTSFFKFCLFFLPVDMRNLS